VNVYELIAENWGIVVKEGEKPSAEQLAIKAVYTYLSYSYWYTALSS
jgi:hypothetical protein